MKKLLVATALAASAASASANSIGHASYYGREFAGKRTASGEVFNPSAMTAAHRTLPFGTRLQLTNLSNGKSVVVRINDRGPFIRGRVIDVSLGAARMLGFASAGTAQLRLQNMGATLPVAATAAPEPEPVSDQQAGKLHFGEAIITDNHR